MHNLVVLVVGSLWVVCVYIVLIYTGIVSYFIGECISKVLIPRTNTIKAQPYPQLNILNNRSFKSLTHIIHRTYKNKDYLYKYIITKHVEVL